MALGVRARIQSSRSRVKVFVDTNILISYLLGSGRNSAVSIAFRAGLQGNFDVVVSQEILDELARSVQTKPYLRSRIFQSDLVAFLHLVAETAEIRDSIDTESLELSRDMFDNFVLMQAIAADVDLILTGDQDLLVLDTIGHIRIVNPNDFLALLAGAEES